MPEGDITGLAGQPEADGGEEAGLGQPNRGMPRWARERIDELTKARREAERQAESERAERQTLSQEIAQLRQQIGQATGQGKPKTWDDLDPDGAHKLIADELARLVSPLKNEETGEVQSADPNLLAKAMRELIRKEIEQRVSAEKKLAAGMTEAQSRIQQARNRIGEDFASLNPFDKNSELRKRAEAEWQKLEKQYGREGLQKRLGEIPDLEYLVFKSAVADMQQEGMIQSPQIARELEVLRRQAGVGVGGENLAEANTRFTAALKKNDLDAAAQELARQMAGRQP